MITAPSTIGPGTSDMLVMMRGRFVLLMFLVVLCGRACTILAAEESTAGTYLGVLYASDGATDGFDEAQYIRKQLVNASALALPDCTSAMVGFLAGAGNQSIQTLLVSTGIGALSAEMCTRTVLDYAPLTAVIWVGTSGLSPFHPGGLNPSVPGGCKRIPIDGSGGTKINPIGSLCIVPVAMSLACGICIRSDASNRTDECSQEVCHGYEFDRCTASVGAMGLSDSVFEATAHFSFPPPPTIVSNYSKKYWQAFGYEVPSDERFIPLVSKNCIEGDLGVILASGPKDLFCRDYGARALNLNHHGVITTSTIDTPLLTAQNVSCFPAMEGRGFLRATSRYPTLPVAIIRGGSNYDMYPLDQESPGVWHQAVEFMGTGEHAEATTAGYAYAIHTTNLAALNYIAKMN